MCPPDNFHKLQPPSKECANEIVRKKCIIIMDMWISFNLISYFLILSVAILIKTKDKGIESGGNGRALFDIIA
jgi:competence protein ComGC